MKITPLKLPKPFKPVKRTKGMIDLTKHYLEDYSYFRTLSEAEVAKKKRAIAYDDSKIEDQPTEIPDWLYPQIRKPLFSFFKLFII